MTRDFDFIFWKTKQSDAYHFERKRMTLFMEITIPDWLLYYVKLYKMLFQKKLEIFSYI